MTYRNFKNADEKNLYKRCIICRNMYNLVYLFNDCCKKCHYPYISLAEFIKNNPPKNI